MNIKKVGVLGCGVMGGQIAAHLNNVGLDVIAFDLDTKIAQNGIDATKKMKPSPFYNIKTAERIKVASFDDLELVKDCDWVIEAIAEKIEWKTGLYSKLAPFLSKDAILTSNTSGLLLSDLTEAMNDSLKKKFFITHFFNPPRYMKLVEFVTSSDNETSTIEYMKNFMTNVLGKGVVFAKDTPNFIANRIGTYGMMVCLQQAHKNNLSVEDVDSWTGTLVGRPKSGTFRTADIVGLDTLSFVAKTAFDKCTDDPERQIFEIPDYLESMIKQGRLGQKSGQGFYKKIDKGVIHSLSLKTLEYSPMEKKRYGSIRIAKESTDLKERLKSLVKVDDPCGNFIWESLSQTLTYAASLNVKISEDIVSIDNAMKWGFGWDLGPFEVWDALGFDYTINRMKEEGKDVPQWVRYMYKKNDNCFYRYTSGVKEYYDFKTSTYKPIEMPSDTLSFEIANENNNLIRRNWSASVFDLGDEVAGVEFHSALKKELNPIDGSILQTLDYALDWVSQHDFKGLVISGDGPNFCAGANLNMILAMAERKDWDSINQVTELMQNIMQKIRFSDFPVIAAPYGLVLGGGFETIGACDRIVAAAESYVGLVEVGVGLIPGAGGNLRMISNLSSKMNSAMPGAFPVVQRAFETVGFAKVGTSAHHAKSYGYLTEEDIIVPNRDQILSKSKKEILKMSPGYKSPVVQSFKLPGASGRLVIKSSIKSFVKAGKISEHDALIAEKLGYVLTGGSKGGPLSPVDEQYLLDIEREVFVSLCGEQKTLDRIGFMLKKGKPLRN
tara:strand:+ start:386 stop:2722 length:2337 start_codon:yes stop_codon:yes gene_type:complete